MTTVNRMGSSQTIILTGLWMILYTNLLKNPLLIGFDRSFPRKEEGKDELSLDRFPLMMICAVGACCTELFYQGLHIIDTVLKNVRCRLFRGVINTRGFKRHSVYLWEPVREDCDNFMRGHCPWFPNYPSLEPDEQGNGAFSVQNWACHWISEWWTVGCKGSNEHKLSSLGLIISKLLRI